MADTALGKLFEHNIWANAKIIQACVGLSDEQLDAQPHSATMGTIRETLTHLVRSQYGYWQMLTGPLEARRRIEPALGELEGYALESGEGLLALARGEYSGQTEAHIRTRDGYLVEPWVVMVQVINHATEHREQIKSMLTALGIAPPDIDGWDFGDYRKGMVRAD